MPNTLMPGITAPELRAKKLDGSIWDLSVSEAPSFTMIIFYRGFHCPVCKNYLEKANTLVDQFRENGVSLVAISMDDHQRAQKATTEWRVSNLEILYGLDVKLAEKWGLWLTSAIKQGEPEIFSEPGLFWILPDQSLYLIEVSNMPFARPDLEILVDKSAAVNNGYPARGSFMNS
jgi:peroxiredoxin